MQLVIPRGALIILTLIIASAAAGILAFIYLPSARVNVHPARHEREVSQDILLLSEATEPDFIKFVLPARQVEHSATAAGTFQRDAGVTSEGFAQGELTLVNNRDEEQQLLPKTHLRHDATGVFFLTDYPVAIPANESVAMRVTAKEQGAAGNVEAGRFTIDKLPESLQSDIFAESQQGFTGGVVVEQPVSEEEIETAVAEVQREAEEAARGGLTAAAGGAAAQDSLLTLEKTEEFISAEAGSKAQEFEVKITVTARALAADENDLLSLTLLALKGGTGDAEEFVAYRPETFSAEIQQADFQRGEARVTGRLTGTYASKIGGQALKAERIAGLTPEEVREFLTNDQAIGEVEVKLSPFWVRTVPSRRGAVEITVANK